MPRYRAADLSIADFEARHLDDVPVILTGASICPRNTSLATVAQHCSAFSGFVSKRSGGHAWAGLRSSGLGGTSIPRFIQTMARERVTNKTTTMTTTTSPQYLFDINTFEWCPALMPRVWLPKHVASSFMRQWSGPWEQCSIGHFNMFLAQGGFQSALHVDQQNFAFTASMCTGRKRWRVVTNRDFLRHRKKLQATGGLRLGDRLMLADVRQPFDTWGPDSVLSTDPDVPVYEGVLSPGEMILIPGGAPHAAETLADEDSLMFASNDGTFTGMAELRDACAKAHRGRKKNARLRRIAQMCKADSYEEHLHVTMQRNHERHGGGGGDAVKAGDDSRGVPFLDAYRCAGQSRWCDGLREFDHSANRDVFRSVCPGRGRVRAFDWEERPDEFVREERQEEGGHAEL